MRTYSSDSSIAYSAQRLREMREAGFEPQLPAEFESLGTGGSKPLARAQAAASAGLDNLQMRTIFKQYAPDQVREERIGPYSIRYGLDERMGEQEVRGVKDREQIEVRVSRRFGPDKLIDQNDPEHRAALHELSEQLREVVQEQDALWRAQQRQAAADAYTQRSRPEGAPQLSNIDNAQQLDAPESTSRAHDLGF
jgi:hypothetical protein